MDVSGYIMNSLGTVLVLNPVTRFFATNPEFGMTGKRPKSSQRYDDALISHVIMIKSA